MVTEVVTEVYNTTVSLTTVSLSGNEHMIEEAQKLYDDFGPQQCEANLATLSDRVSKLNSFLYYVSKYVGCITSFFFTVGL